MTQSKDTENHWFNHTKYIKMNVPILQTNIIENVIIFFVHTIFNNITYLYTIYRNEKI